jgi:hypothetical protein
MYHTAVLAARRAFAAPTQAKGSNSSVDMTRKSQRISKSQYLKGLQCPKALWLYRHRPELKPDISMAQQHLFDMGHEIGLLAQRYFGQGCEIHAQYYEIDRAVDLTAEAVDNGEKVIFEASACSPDGAYSRIDILKKNRHGIWDLIEVKGSTGIKDYHLDDMALQRYAFSNSGFNIEKSFLMHINNAYVRNGALDLKQLFTLEDCTGEVRNRMRNVQADLARMMESLNSPVEPEWEVGGHCHSPFMCDYLEYCWKEVPEYSVYNIFSGWKLDELLGDGILHVADVPESFDTTPRQDIEINAFKNGQIHVDRVAIKDFVNQLQYPLYYLDYETVMPAVPLFDGTHPYQQLPFQFSLHIQKKRGGPLEHIEFLHTAQSDPRPEFVRKLVSCCGDKGAIVVYNKGFEAHINNQLAEAFPQHAQRLSSLNQRMVDLLIPFRSRHLYHPDMRGSASLKSVLPALVPKLSYTDLTIGDGETAAMMYLSCLRDAIPQEEKSEIYRHLKKYCAQDTLAEVKLIEILYAQL